MAHNIAGYMVRFTTWSHCYIKMRQISQVMNNFILLILLKQQQNRLKTTHTRAMLGTDKSSEKSTHLLSYK
jgi:hypothetical protein